MAFRGFIQEAIFLLLGAKWVTQGILEQSEQCGKGPNESVSVWPGRKPRSSVVGCGASCGAGYLPLGRKSLIIQSSTSPPHVPKKVNFSPSGDQPKSP